MTKYQNKLERNISISYIFNLLMFFRPTSAIWVIYLSSRGLNLVEIGLLESVFHVTCFLCEVPTGALADIYGRKFSVILGRVCAALSTVLMVISQGFVGYGIAFIFSALSYTFNSGAAESLTYDSLKQLNREKEYKRISGIIYFLTEIGQGLAVVLGGLLSDIRFIYAYLLSLIVEIVALTVSTAFQEPLVREKEEREKLHLQIIISAKVLNKRRVVLYLILFFSLISTMGTTVYFYSQKYFENLNYSRTMIAGVFAVNSIINALSSKYAYKIEGRIEAKGMILMLPLLNVVSLIGLSLAKGYYIILFFYITSFIGGISYPVFSDYINSLIPSEQRATILSFESCTFSIFMIIIFPLFGLVGDKLGLTASFMGTAVLFVPTILFLMLKLNKHSEKRKEFSNEA